MFSEENVNSPQAIGVQRKEDVQLLEGFFLPYSKCRECSDERGEGCNERHHLVIEKTYVLKALGEFVSKLHASKFRYVKLAGR